MAEAVSRHELSTLCGRWSNRVIELRKVPLHGLAGLQMDIGTLLPVFGLGPLATSVCSHAQ